MAWAHLQLEGQSIIPLPPNLRRGLIAITVLALVSFISSTALFLYLTYKLVVWRFFVRRRQPRRPSDQPQRPRRASQQTTDFTLGIDGIFTEGDVARPASRASAEDDRLQHQARQDVPRPRDKSPPPNQFLVLIYNLLLADMHQSMAFLLNATWLRRDGVMVGTSTCFAQGFFVSTGDMSSSMFITTIAVHTYLSVVRRRRPSQRLLYLVVVANWLFVYLISSVPIAATRNGYDVGGFFVRAGAWCWINNEYENLRLATHYLFIFIALGTTTALYIAVFISLRQQQSRARKAAGADAQTQISHKPAFLIYPVIYVACTLPLALGRIATMAGRHVPLGYFCFAGAIIAFNGSFDCLLFGTTRSVLIFGSTSDLDADDTGLGTFAFLKTPSTRQYGNMVWIRGGDERASKRADETAGGWWSWKRLGGSKDDWPGKAGHRNTSQESLRGTAIQMDMVTSVVVEVEKNHDLRYPSVAASAGTSMKSADRDSSDG